MIPYNRNKIDQAISSGRKIYLYFYLRGCGPCKTITPLVEDFAKYNEVYGIEGDDDRELKQALRAVSYPSLVVIEDQVLIKNATGGNQIKSILNTYGTSNQ